MSIRSTLTLHVLPWESWVTTGDYTREALKKFNNKTTLQITQILPNHIIRNSVWFFTPSLKIEILLWF